MMQKDEAHGSQRLAHWSRWRPSPSMAVSLVALFVALSGSALAIQGEHRSLAPHR